MQMLAGDLMRNNNAATAADAGRQETFFKPAIQREDAPQQQQQVTTPAWSKDLLTIIVFDDSYKGNCFGSASPGEVLTLSSCLTWPSCVTFRIPFRVEFYVDRMNAPHPQPIEPGPVSINITFTPTGKQPNVLYNATDPKPVYKGPNLVLEPSFGKTFPVDITTDGVLNVKITMHDAASSEDVVYTDSKRFVVLCS